MIKDDLTLTLTPTMVTVLSLAMDAFKEHGMPDKPLFGCDVGKVVDAIGVELDYMHRMIELHMQGNAEGYNLCRADLAMYEAGMLAEMSKLEAETTF